MDHPLRWSSTQAPTGPKQTLQPALDEASPSHSELWRAWQAGLDAVSAGACCAAADRFFEAVRVALDALWDAHETDETARLLTAVAPLAADVLHAHGDGAGAADLLEFACHRGRRDPAVVQPYLSLLIEREEWSEAGRVLDDAQQRDPQQPDLGLLRRRLEHACAASGRGRPSRLSRRNRSSGEEAP